MTVSDPSLAATILSVSTWLAMAVLSVAFLLTIRRVVAGPTLPDRVLALDMLVGIVIALLQALTQVQEMTLTFVPKIGAILAVGVISAPFIYQGLSRFAFDLFERVATGF